MPDFYRPLSWEFIHTGIDYRFIILPRIWIKGKSEPFNFQLFRKKNAKVYIYLYDFCPFFIDLWVENLFPQESIKGSISYLGFKLKDNRNPLFFNFFVKKRKPLPFLPVFYRPLSCEVQTRTFWITEVWKYFLVDI